MSEIKKPSPQQRKTSPDIHVDDRFLQDHLRDSRAEMAWRRELEFRLLQFMLVFFPVIGTAMIELFRSNISWEAFSITALCSVILIIATTFVVTDRIKREHNTYAEIGKQVQLIWTYFGLFEPGAYLKDQAFLPEKLLDEKAGLGQGPGYLHTIKLIWRITAALILILAALAFFKAVVI